MPSAASIFPSREIFIPAINFRMSSLSVFVVPAKPEVRLVAPLRRAVEPLVHAPEAVESARIGGIGVVDGAVLEDECAHAGPLARISGHVGSGHAREQGSA